MSDLRSAQPRPTAVGNSASRRHQSDETDSVPNYSDSWANPAQSSNHQSTILAGVGPLKRNRWAAEGGGGDHLLPPLGLTPLINCPVRELSDWLTV